MAVWIGYHGDDLDGHCSGAIVRHAVSQEGQACQMLPLSYGKPYDWPFSQDDEVYFVDWAPAYEVLEQLRDTVRRVVVIDHHKTTRVPPGVVAVLPEAGQTLAACELAAMHFWNRVPELVQLVGVYDTWRREEPQWSSLVLPVQYGLRLETTDPRTEEGMDFWLRAWDDPAAVLRLQARGEPVLAYIRQADSRRMQRSFAATFEGLRALAHIGDGGGSNAFASVWSPERYDLMLSVLWSGTAWVVSLYTDHPGMDLTPLAKKYGGGGHAQACGFVLPADKLWEVVQRVQS